MGLCVLDLWVSFSKDVCWVGNPTYGVFGAAGRCQFCFAEATIWARVCGAFACGVFGGLAGLSVFLLRRPSSCAFVGPLPAALSGGLGRCQFFC